MRVERSTLDQVKKRFEVNKKKMEEKQKDYDFEERMKELREEVKLCCPSFSLPNFEFYVMNHEAVFLIPLPPPGDTCIS